MSDVTGRSSEPPEIELGIAGLRVPVHSHLASIVETAEDFVEAVDFVLAGLRGRDACVLIGDSRDNERTLSELKEGGVDVERAVSQKRLVVILREPTAEGMVESVTGAFEAALAAGAPLVRLFGTVGWGREAGPSDAELLRYEARLTDLARRFPCVILCLHDVHAVTGTITRHGVLPTHPRKLTEGKIIENPFFQSSEAFAPRVPALAARLSEQQAGQEAQRRETEILQTIFDRIPGMISFFDASGRYTLVNREWERVLGWSLEEARRMDVLAEVYPDPAERDKALAFIARADGRWVDFRSRTRDGRFIETSWMRIALSDGTSIGFGQDITDRARTLEALREKEQRFRAVFESALDAVIISDASGRIVEINPAARSIFGRRQEDFVGRHWTELTAPGADMAEDLRAFRDGGHGQGEWRVQRPDGTVRDMEYSARADFLPGRHLAVLRDVTERKRLERKLRRSEAYLTTGQELSRTASWSWNIASGEVFWYGPMARILGAPPDAVPSLALFLEQVHPQDRLRIEEEIVRALHQRADLDLHFRTGGSSIPVTHVHSRGRARRDASGAVVEYVGAVIDESERHQTEERLLQSTAELRALSERLRLAREEERTKIAREVHDELGQSLTALRIDLAWLEQRLPAAGAQPSEVESKLRAMSALIDTTLGAVQRIATELRPGVLDELGLEAAIEWYVREFEQRTGIACRFDSGLAASPIDARCSTAAFRILQEALTNVARHSVATRARIGLSSDAELLRLEIRDNGRGIAADRIESSASLGLVGMRERARALGGDLEIRGTTGHGTSVALTIPL